MERRLENEWKMKRVDEESSRVVASARKVAVLGYKNEKCEYRQST